MRSLLEDMQVDDKFVKEMFLERLPADVQTILASGSQDLTVSQLAEIDDRMIEVQRFQSASVAQISSSSSSVNENLVKQAETGKPVGQRIDATVFSGSSGSGRTFYVCDTATRRRFLVYTGAQISVVTPTATDRRFPSPGLHLQAANCSPISTFGSLSLTLNIGHRRSFTWIFVIADVPHAILGSDFHAKFDLLVDCQGARLLDRTTGLFVRGLTPFTVPTNLSVLDTDVASPFRQLLLSDPKISNPQFRSGAIQHDVVHHIRTSGPPVFARPRRLAPERFQAAKAEFEHMLQLGIIRPSESPSCPKQHQATGDPVATIQPSTALPLLIALFRKAVFSKIDLVRAFHQVPVAPENIPKTAVTTPFGLFEFFRMPFGLRNAAQTFQRFIDHVLRGLPFVYAYIDDLLVASRNEEENKERLALVFDRLDKFGVVINSSKCVLGVPSLEFLGHQVDSEGLRPLPSKVEAVRNFPPPTSKRQLQRFLGMLLPAETRYSTFGRELLVIYLAVKHFRHFLEGCDFTVFTDHKPMTFALCSHSDKYNPREIAHLDYISQFTTDIRHIGGTKNEVADMLSRPSLSSLQLTHGIELCAMVAEQQRVSCPCDESVSGLLLKDVPPTTGSGTTLCDVSTPFHRPFVPSSMR
nr:unnamed protein product [Spirometra erinaceieuropaei]